MPNEATKTQKARTKIIEMLKSNGYQVTEEEVFPCKNNMDEPIFPFYQADIVARKIFIIELDPIFHGSKIHKNKDEWRDENIKREYQIKTVRVDPLDVLKQDHLDTLIEIDSQLCRDKQRNDTK